jgi:hypothetical protein
MNPFKAAARQAGNWYIRRLCTAETTSQFSGPIWATGDRIPWQQAQSEDEPHQLGCFEFEKV